MKSSTDIWFTAFLVKKGFEIKDFTLIGKGKARYTLMINEEDWKKCKMEFHNSEISQYKAIFEKLKDLIH
jgi:hypothetical protein